MLEQLQQWMDSFFASGPFSFLILSSAILILSIVIIRSLIARYIRSRVTSTELRRRWLDQSRNGLLLLLLVGLLFIWGEEPYA